MKMDVEDTCGIKIKEEVKECLSPTSTTHAPCLTGATNAPTITTPTSHPPTLKQIPTTNNNPEPSPVNLNLKPRSKGSNQPSKDRQSGESSPSTTDARPTSPGSQRPVTQSSIASRSTAMHEVRRNSSSRSPDCDSPLPPAIKLETGESTVNKLLTVNVIHEEVSPGATSSGIGSSSGQVTRVHHAQIKRVLGTSIQFASNISTETGDTVRGLVLSLLSGNMTVEEFHGALQDATNVPLRTFVLPYLKHTLPSLQRDLTNAARANNQTVVQYLHSNEAVVLEVAGFSPGEAGEVFGERNAVGPGCLFPSYNIVAAVTGSTNSTSATNTGTTNVPASVPGLHGSNQHSCTTNLHHYNGPPPPQSHSLKRRASDSPYYENNVGPVFDDGPLYGKRAIIPRAGHHPLHHQRQQQQQQPQSQPQPQPQPQPHSDAYCWYHPLHQSGSQASLQSHGQSSMPPSLVQINHLAASSTISTTPDLVNQQPWTMSSVQGTSSLQNRSCPAAATTLDDEWKYIHVMLNCILGMVEKTKRALAILQRRGFSSPAIPVTTATTSAGSSSQNNGPAMNTASKSDANGSEGDNSLKRITGEIVTQTVRAMEDRVTEVQRRAEEAMLETKRVAVAEVQRTIAVAAAAAERVRDQHRLFELPKQRSHGHAHGHGLEHDPLLRIIDTTTCTATTATTTTTTMTTSNAMGTRDDEKESQIVPGSSCWNCGRQALETCGGCGIARYCGSFCQHKDWEAGGHHATCNTRRPTPPPPQPPPPPPLPRPASRSPTASSGTTITAAGTSGPSSSSVSTGTSHTGRGK